MNKNAQIKKDSDIIEEAMEKYGGSDGAHFGFIAFATGERQFIAGGNVAITGICLSEAIATMIQNTPGLGEEFIDAVADTAKGILKKGGPLQ
jgi:hypothetical protein